MALRRIGSAVTPDGQSSNDSPQGTGVSFGLPLDWTQDTFEQRRDRIRRRVRQVVAVGVALTAFVVALAASDPAALIYQRTPFWFSSFIFTLIVFAGVALGAAYVRYEEEASNMELAIERRPRPSTGQGPGKRWPESAERFWRAALLLTIMAPIAFLVASWWASIDGARGH